MNTDKLLRVGEVAEILRVSPMTVIRWCDSNYLPYIKIGVSRRIKEADLAYILKSDIERKPIKSPEPVYDGPSAEELGFDDDADEIIRQNELKKQCEAVKVKIEAMKAMKAMKAEKVNEVSALPNTEEFADYQKKQSTGVQRTYPSGFGTH